MKDLLKKQKKSKNELVESVIADYEDRKLKKRSLELQWQLNLDFYAGKQNSILTNFDTLVQAGKQFFWQRNESFNHIAPIIEGRLAKITAYKGSDEGFNALVERATMWSEVVGSVFYKVSWDTNAGVVVGIVKDDRGDEQIHEGDVRVSVCSPFEIFPDNLHATDVSELASIIHAKYKDDVTIERYEVPSKKHPNGRLIIVAGEKLLHDGELPYINGEDGKRCLPFVRQVSEDMVGTFFGRSVVERAIPVQRAYNNIKNRKVEFLNRLACGVLAVEEGSVDLESLENDGLAPGKVIVYRHGSSAPKFLETGTLPAELEREEERLLREFEIITGGGEIMRTAEGGDVSGHALTILEESSYRRLGRTIQSMTNAVEQIKKQMTLLHKQFN